MTGTGGIDWEQVKQRLARATASLDAVISPTHAAKTAILRTRARVLAGEVLQEQRPDHYIEMIEFMLAYEKYGLDCAFVREVHPLKDITALPGAPAFVAGIVNVRGQIVSVIDLKSFFDLPRKGLTDLNRVIILNDGVMEFGLLVDAVLAVQRLALDDIQPALPTLTGARAKYLQGVTRQHAIILSAAKLLADPDILCTG